MIRSTLTLCVGLFSTVIAAQNEGALVCWQNCDSAPIGASFEFVRSARDHFYGWSTQGGAYSWGYCNSSSGECEIPKGVVFKHLSISPAQFYSHGVGVTSEGSIRCWGNNTFGQLNGPSGDDFVYCFAGEYFSAAIREDGTIEFWGDPEFDCMFGWPEEYQFISVECGKKHCVGITTEGGVECWGCGPAESGEPPSGPSNYVMADAGEYHSIALRADGSAYAWGLNSYGQSSVLPGEYTFVSANWYSTAGVTTDGQAYAWGDVNSQPGTEIKLSQIAVSSSRGVGLEIDMPEPILDGSCCINGSCVVTSLQACFESGGSFAGPSTDCATTNCPSSCDGDVSENGTVDFTDLLILINNWGNCPG